MVDLMMSEEVRCPTIYSNYLREIIAIKNPDIKKGRQPVYPGTYV